MKFVERMYLYRYLKKVGADLVALGYKACGGGHNVAMLLLSKKDFEHICKGHFEKLSPACMDYLKNVLHSKSKADSHLRMTLKAKDLQNIAISIYGDNNIVATTDEWTKHLDTVESLWNQRNKGYAFEKAVYEYFGLVWNPRKRGCDLEGIEINGEYFNIECKYCNGQIKL